MLPGLVLVTFWPHVVAIRASGSGNSTTKKMFNALVFFNLMMPTLNQFSGIPSKMYARFQIFIFSV